MRGASRWWSDAVRAALRFPDERLSAEPPTEKGGPLGTPFSYSLTRRLGFFGVIKRRMLVEDLEDLRLRGLFVAFLHRGEFAREAARCRFEDLTFRIALLGLVVGAEQVAGHLGNRHKVTRVDLRFIFLRAARPHGALHLRFGGEH